MLEPQSCRRHLPRPEELTGRSRAGELPARLNRCGTHYLVGMNSWQRFAIGPTRRPGAGA